MSGNDEKRFVGYGAIIELTATVRPRFITRHNEIKDLEKLAGSSRVSRQK